MAAMDGSTRRVIAAYMEQASAPMFLSGNFQSPPTNFHNSEKIEIDVQRDSEEVAIVIQDLSTGTRANETGKYVSKAFTPPIFDEEATINSFDLIKRMPGESPFADPDVQANAIASAFNVMRKLENKIRRAVELQCAQVLQTGKVSLTDSAGNVLYELDYQPKTSHFVTVGTPWAASGATGDPMGDVAALAELIRQHGRKNPTQVILGSAAQARFMANTAIKAQLASIGLQRLANVAPETRGEGATYIGKFWVANYYFDFWAYNGGYVHPQTGLWTPYVDPFKVIILSEGARLDLSFGAIPRFIPPDQRVLPYLPTRMSSEGRGLDLSTYAWITPNGKHLNVSVGTRPLAIPTAIDTFGTLTVGS